jgi:hypothetical protein
MGRGGGSEILQRGNMADTGSPRAEGKGKTEGAAGALMRYSERVG